MSETTIFENDSSKIVKTVDDSSYTAFCFFWKGPFRVIYSVSQELNGVNTNFTVWTLDKKTGIWGCFADAHDLGFDYKTIYANSIESVPINQREDLDVLEQFEDKLLLDFLERARSHINKLYPDCAIPTISLEISPNVEWEPVEPVVDQV